MPKDGGIGASSKRREDIRFLTGEGNYTDDINLHGQAHVFFLRSDIAHGVLNSVDTSAADGMPGVVKIFTGADFAEVGSIPCGWQITPCWPTVRCAMWANRLPPSLLKPCPKPAMRQKRLLSISPICPLWWT